MIYTLQNILKRASFLGRTLCISSQVQFWRAQYSTSKMPRSKVIIDTDPGIDDAVAVALALTSPNIEVLALTCVSGNVDVDQACRNASKILDVFGRKDVPIFRGNERSLIGADKDAKYFHGSDGLGDAVQHIPYPEDCVTNDTHASLVIIDFAKKYPGEITLVAIGPLTNLAVAYHLCPKLPQLLKRVLILGGNYAALGNITPSAEFNFYADPEAATVVLEHFDCPKWVVPWDSICEKEMKSAFWKEYVSQGTKRSEFLGKMVLSIVDLKNPESTFYASDAFAVALAIDPSIIVKAVDFWACVETSGCHTRGMAVVDRRLDAPKRGNLTTFIMKTDDEKVKKMLLESVM